MERHEVINALSGGRYRDYLEIGVDHATTFNRVAIPNRTGVDPHFKVPREGIRGETVVATSDDFFRANTRSFDCVFIDGLHTYAQSRRDFVNAWACLRPGGTVVLDDCFPADDLAALPDLDACLRGRRERGTPGDLTWMGDVYKTVIWLHDCTEHRFAYVENTRGGIVVVWPGRRRRTARWLPDEAAITACSYERFLTLPLPSASLSRLAREVAPRRLLSFLPFGSRA
ncbi:class I SAM-dependent methyltransferase [Methylobacterium oryzihabitans]|uniref:Class I SAM-dependent methyltransferase n=1 Tax=Methylobacterium oryzihabitans TaxID=2499852 RepID=A0A437P3Q7_9HYPH|nr:class I SAM-dependent methyltransferase [Methylobacterium oryzihabitans]RVU16893.1 class I SAM-dependent methyltransferase [Methylobacterium oryzihabitans]